MACTLHGLPVGYALAGQRQASGRSLLDIGDKSFYGRDLGDEFARARIVLLGLARNTLKGQLDLERHGGRTVDGVTVCILQRILALTAAIWHNDTTGQATSCAHWWRMTTDPLE